MRFAKIVFWTAGIWGILVITPLFFMFNLIGRKDPPPITHPGFYYGFATAALAWQIVFLVIASDPVRFRPLMIPSVVEKFAYGAAVVALFLESRMRLGDLLLGSVDILLGVLFVAAFFKTRVDAVAREAREREQEKFRRVEWQDDPDAAESRQPHALERAALTPSFPALLKRGAKWKWGLLLGVICLVLIAVGVIRFLGNQRGSPHFDTNNAPITKAPVSDELNAKAANPDVSTRNIPDGSPLSISPQGYVTDLAHIVEPGVRKQLQAICSEVQQKTGAQIAVVTVRSLGGRSVDGFSNALFMHFGIGSKKDNRGVLLLLAPTERKWRVEVGYGLEPVITNNQGEQIGNQMMPDLKRGDYSAALLIGVTRIAQLIGAESKVQLNTVPAGPTT